MSYIDKYNFWLNNNLFDNSTKQELQTISHNDDEIKDRFYKDLSFGTGGLRGILGAGTNRLNIYTIRKATQGLANFIIHEHAQSRGVAIAYDSRNMSKEFSEETALCLNANGIKTYIFDSLRPTPMLSFAVRELNCIAGVVITASHNPPEYNGYKVYWEDGAQITSPKDKEIIAFVNNITDYNCVKTISKNDAITTGLYNTIGNDLDDKYNNELKKLVLNPDVISKMSTDLKIVYTPLHGTGNIPVQRILADLGFKNVYVVPEQENPDGNFSTVKTPNPENSSAFELALNLAKKTDADIVIATDPDADRLGLYAKDSKTGKYVSFTGNMTGILIGEYELSQMKSKNMITDNGAILTTIVSSSMGQALATEYNIDFIEVLTGFKYIGEQIKFFEQNKDHTYLYGYEESNGCLIGTHSRDKDAIVSVMALCEAAAFYKLKGLTLWDQMINIYNKYGYYREGQSSITIKGADGADKIKSILSQLRNNPPSKIGKYNIEKIRDYKTGVITHLLDKSTTPTNLPTSNVLYYELEHQAWCCIRPSGTEPKCKIYYGVNGTGLSEADDELSNLKDALLNIIK